MPCAKDCLKCKYFLRVRLRDQMTRCPKNANSAPGFLRSASFFFRPQVSLLKIGTFLGIQGENRWKFCKQLAIGVLKDLRLYLDQVFQMFHQVQRT